MTENLKPTSKVIQISTTMIEYEDLLLLTALCEDGSIWQLYNGKWECILEAPKPAAPTIPIPGSWWIKGKEKVYVSGLYVEDKDSGVLVSLSGDNDIDCFEEDLETFLKLYKPLEVND